MDDFLWFPGVPGLSLKFHEAALKVLPHIFFTGNGIRSQLDYET